MTRIADFIVEKVHLGEATEAERALVLADPDARARLDALPTQDRAFLSAFPAEEELRRIADRARVAAARADAQAQAGPNRTPWAVMVAPLLAAVIGLVWIATPSGTDGVPVTDGGSIGVQPEPTTSKGLEPRLHLYRLQAGGPESLRTGSFARRGDVLQIGVVPGWATDGVVVSVDGRGAVTLHWPADRTASTALGSGELHLPAAYELDDAPAFERFFLVATDGPTDVDSVVHAAEALAAQPAEALREPLALPRGYAQSSVVVRKEGP